MGNIKEINIKSRTYYFFDDMINIKDFDPSLLKIGKNSCKNIGISYIGYITMKNSDHVKINSIILLSIIINEVDGSIAEKSGNKYLTLGSTYQNKKVFKKYTKLLDEINYHIKTISCGKSGEHEEDFMKTKFNSDDDLPINKILKLHNLTIILRFVFEKDGKYYPQVFLDEFLYEL